ncbi:protein kinase [Colletotrichum higginsianum]|uniref:Protein kinase n=1 Tax=Colletotrichum higginsianum (strain IMI 349063) TaxID=759273 RepID=H1VEK9_COLHI|nr:protein kinase [Colletotrichum higginsianum]
MAPRHLPRFLNLILVPYGRSIRSISTLVGQSGRVYTTGVVLQRHREDHNLSVFKAEADHNQFVVKRVPKPFYNMSVRLAAEFAGSPRLRMHVDCNHDESVLVYPYYKCTLLSLIQNDPEFPTLERKKILRHTGEAIQELHSKGCIHIGMFIQPVVATHDGSLTATS